MKGMKGKPILIFVAILVGLYCIIYVVPSVTGALRSSYTVEYGELKVSDETDAYIVRSEKVYFAGTGGEENRYIKAGKLIRKGTRVMALTGESDSAMKRTYNTIRENIGKAGITTKSFKAKSEGIVSYNVDGQEGEFTPGTIKDKTYEDFQSLAKVKNVDLARETVSKGDPVFKIVDRSAWYLVCYLSTDHKDRYQKGERYTIRMDGETEIYGKVTSVSTEGTRLKLVIRTDYYYKSFASKRTVPVEIITSDSSGLVIYNTSITEKKGQQGVYVQQNNGKYEFTPISVISSDGKQSIIESSYFYDSKGSPVRTVQNYDEVLRKP